MPAYTVGETGLIVVSRPDDAIESGAERVLLVCAPFADANLNWEDDRVAGAMSTAVPMAVEARLAIREASTSYEYLLREETSFAFVRHEVPAVDDADSNGSTPKTSEDPVEGEGSGETESEPNRTEGTERGASSILSTNSFLPRFQNMLPSLSALALYGSQTDEELREALYVTTSATAMAGSLSPLPGTADTYMIGNNDDVVVNINFRSQVESILFGTGVTPAKRR